MAEISRSGDGDDHNKGREVRGDGGGCGGGVGGHVPPARLNLPHLCVFGKGGIIYAGWGGGGGHACSRSRVGAGVCPRSQPRSPWRWFGHVSRVRVSPPRCVCVYAMVSFPHPCTCATAPAEPAELCGREESPPRQAKFRKKKKKITIKKFVSSGFFLNQNSWIVNPNFQAFGSFPGEGELQPLGQKLTWFRAARWAISLFIIIIINNNLDLKELLGPSAILQCLTLFFFFKKFPIYFAHVGANISRTPTPPHLKVLSYWFHTHSKAVQTQR